MLAAASAAPDRPWAPAGDAAADTTPIVISLGSDRSFFAFGSQHARAFARRVHEHRPVPWRWYVTERWPHDVLRFHPRPGVTGTHGYTDLEAALVAMQQREHAQRIRELRNQRNASHGAVINSGAVVTVGDRT